MNMNLAVIRGDGIGPEVIAEAIKILDEIASLYNHTINYTEVLAGGIAIEEAGECLPQSTVQACKDSDAVLLGAVGGPKWDDLPGSERPEQALLGLRKALNLYANIRPAIMFDALSDACPLKEELVKGGINLVVVRELTGGIYFGEKGRKIVDGYEAAYDVEEYNVMEVERIAITAFKLAMKRDKKVTSVDKANVLESSRLWRTTVNKVSKDYPEVELNHQYVDNAAMQIVRGPKQFDVILTSNIFGDILSDEASQVTGSIGMLPSSSLSKGNFGMYEPIHGSAPDIAGQNIANPMATILSCAMMLRTTFNLTKEADAIEAAVTKTLNDGYRTMDIAKSGEKVTGTKEIGDIIKNNLKNLI
ncbi:MAG: 3-isopropylmalate dehydrogenase [Peptostreptococcaceae bacterium]|nr:3-isopropylmalate dehydrogenase [Peptostreptococcaceae bacterium]